MKHKALIFGSILILIILIIIAIILLNNSKSEKEYLEEISKGNAGASCSQNSDCQTPFDYLIRSNCPFTSICAENKCVVACVKPYETQEDQINKTPQCSKDKDCDCNSFYVANDLIKCSCINEICAAIISE